MTKSANAFSMVTNAAELQVFLGVCSWMTCSVGMMVFNKQAIVHFPLECTLVGLQMATSVVAMLCCWQSLHFGSWRDVARWLIVVPFFPGMLLTSILALKYAPMTLVITFRALSPLLSLAVERFYPNPLAVNAQMMLAIFAMVMGTATYAYDMPREHWHGVGWVMLNLFCSVGERLLQSLMLSKDQNPVDISKTGVTLINNLVGIAPILIIAWSQNELHQMIPAFAGLGWAGWVWLAASCLVGVGISYCGIWAQSLISATSFLVLVNANKFVIIFVEVFVMHVKTLTLTQITGAVITVVGGIYYGYARKALEAQVAEEKTETSPLISAKV